jgi:hypothetical protein
MPVFAWKAMLFKVWPWDSDVRSVMRRPVVVVRVIVVFGRGGRSR